MPQSRNLQSGNLITSIGPLSKERARERAYLLYSRGRGAERYVSLLDGQAPRLLGSGSAKLPLASSRVPGYILVSPVGISE